MSVRIADAIRAAWQGPDRRRWIWASFAAALGVGLGQVPLFGVLGFELATAAALFAAVMGLDVGSARARDRQRALARMNPPATGRGFGHGALAAAGDAMAVAAIPAAVAAVRGLWVPTCDWRFGLETYLAMPIATAALAGALGHAVGAMTGPRRYIGAALAQLPVLVVVVAALWRFYGEPPVFSYNAILGYFPGNLYDEDIRLRAPLAWSRLADLAWVVVVVGGVALRLDGARYRVAWRGNLPQRRGLAIVVAVALLGGLTLRHFSGALGYAVSADELAEVLDGRRETAHFVIHYARDPDVEEDLDVIAEDHELRYAEVVAQIGIAPPGKIASFYFADHEQKARWFGARDVEMAKPWRREIYLDHRSFPHSSLRHEIAHAVASAFGDPIFGVAARHGVFISPGLIEGLAVALDWPGGYDRPTPHEAVRAMQALGVQPAIGQLLSLAFFSVSSARGYTTAGSFLRYLLDTYGAAKLRALYRSGGDFADAYGQSRDDLEAGWRKMIGAIVLPPGQVEAQRERFRGGSVFARPCPHAIAAWRVKAAEAMADGERDRAIALLRRVCAVSPDEPRHSIELADRLFGGSEVERFEAIARWAQLAGDDDRATSTVRVEVLERLAREAALRSDRRGVAAWIAAAATLPLDSAERRQLDAERFALAHRGPAADALYAYFFQPGPLPTVLLAQWAVLVEPSLGFGHYLLGLQHTLRGKWRAAAEEMARGLELGLPGPAFVRNAARRLAVAAYRDRDPARVAIAIAVLRGPNTTTADHLLADDWQARLDFDAGKPLR